MPRMIEYLNPKSHTIQLPSPDKKTIKIPGKSKIILSDWYMTYCPQYLRVVRIVEGKNNLTPKKVKPAPTNKRPRRAPEPRQTARDKRAELRKKQQQTRLKKHRSARKATAQVVKARDKRTRGKENIVGRRSRENTQKLYKEAHQKNLYSISNNIGVGILSFNRLSSLQRLVHSIRVHTDLSRTTIFVSDESTNAEVSQWLKKQKDIVVLTNQKRIGVAGNTNRLLRCLSRFKYGILLNDDVEILSKGWERFYLDAHQQTQIHHFCYQQAGVYGSKKNNKHDLIGGVKVKTINDKPHGAVMFYTNEIFNKIGYFDEGFGMYGMEHVDWSSRASKCGMQKGGFHDVMGSERYFKIHQEKSAVPERTKSLSKARTIYKEVNSASRVYVNPTKASEVPSISVIIPIRDIGRKKAVEIVVNSIRSQLFPNVEIIISEQDELPRVKQYDLGPRRYFFAKNKYKGQPFTKAMALNLGVANASNEKVVLQDADIICPATYLQKIHKILDQHTGAHIGSKVLYLTKETTENIGATFKLNKNANCDRVVEYYEGGSLACTKEAYFKCGAFNEIFEGYGIEDCDFFIRLKHSSNFYNERTEDLVHMWHGRTNGWAQHHRRNKKIYAQIRNQYNTPTYISSLTSKLKKLYPQVSEHYKL